MFKRAIKGARFHEKKDRVGNKCYETWVNYVCLQPKTNYPKSRSKGICIIGGVLEFGAFVKGRFAIQSNNKYSPKKAGSNRAEIRRAAKAK